MASDHEATFDAIGTLLAGFLKAAVVSLFPAIFFNRRLPIGERLYRWRFVYLGYVVAGLLTFHHGLLAGGRPRLVGIAALSFGHLAAPATLWQAGTTGQVPGIEFPFISDGAVAAAYSSVLVGVIGFETVRRIRPALLNLEETRVWETTGTYRLPMATVDDSSEEASLPPKLDQDVSTAFIGETGSGKTSAMRLLAYQLPYDQDTAVVAHDYGEEFQQFYEELGFDVLRISVEGSDVIWNLFRDIEHEREFREIAGAIFQEPSGNNPFFKPAKQVFEDALRYLYREAKEQDSLRTLGHDDILTLINQDPYSIYKRLNRYDDLKAVHLDPDRGKGTKNVYQTLHEHVDPVFIGDFARDGYFSLREYIENPDGQVLVIDSDPTMMETLGPMFRLLCDWAIRYGMGADDQTVFILDEIDRLPPMTQLPDLAARGRSENATTLLGVQTVGQLRTTYDSHSAILGNCPQGVYFSPGDSESTDYILDEVGEMREVTQRRQYSVSKDSDNARARRSNSFEENDRTPILSGELKQADPGDCVVKARNAWWHGRIQQLDDVADRFPDPLPDDPDDGLESTLAEVQDAAADTDGANTTADPTDTDPDNDHTPGRQRDIPEAYANQDRSTQSGVDKRQSATENQSTSDQHPQADHERDRDPLAPPESHQKRRGQHEDINAESDDDGRESDWERLFGA
jgi:hypothetical protein